MEVEFGRALRLWQGEVLGDWLDYNQHMTEHRYLQVFGESSDAFYQLIGLDFADPKAGAYFTLSTHVWHRAEGRIGTRLWSETEVLGYDERFLHLFHRLYADDSKLLAEGEHLTIHVRNGKSQPALPEMLARVAQVFQAQKDLPTPAHAGLVVSRPMAFRRSGQTVIATG